MTPDVALQLEQAIYAVTAAIYFLVAASAISSVVALVVALVALRQHRHRVKMDAALAAARRAAATYRGRVHAGPEVTK